MSVHYEQDRNRWVVRWREDGRQRSRTFPTEGEAQAFNSALNPPSPAHGVVEEVQTDDPSSAAGDKSGVYPYTTSAGTRWRYVYRQSDGRITTRRGFTNRTAAVTARGMRCPTRGAAGLRGHGRKHRS